jgi:hypothetical protein
MRSHDAITTGASSLSFLFFFDLLSSDAAAGGAEESAGGAAFWLPELSVGEVAAGAGGGPEEGEAADGAAVGVGFGVV